jgi:mono/diheme cytochrome c family protein
MMVPASNGHAPSLSRGDAIMKHLLKNGLRLTALCLPLVATAQLHYDMGKTIYQDNCASCHGLNGKGDGPLKAYLVKAPSDLTTITQRNHGVFPQQRLWEIIDGRSSADAGPHGSREMPIWGNEFKAQADRAPWWGMPYGGMHRGGPEWHVQQKISALVDYLARIQVR